MAVPTKLASSNNTEHKSSTPMLHVLQPTSVIAPSNSLFTNNNLDQDDSMGQHSTSPPLASLLTPPTSSSANGRHHHQHNGPIVISVAAPATGDYYPVSRPTRESVLQRLSEGLLRRSLTKIDLSQRGLRPSDARLVKMALSQNANLTVLKLGYNNLGDAGVIILAAGIAIHRSIASLDLGFNNVGDEGCKALADAMTQQHERYLEDQRHQQQQHNQHQSDNKNRMALSTSSSLEDMVLSETPVTSMSTSTHANTPLFNRTSIGGSGKRPRNNGGNVSSSVAMTTTTTVSGGTLRTLYLAGNLIGEDGALAMADCIRRGSSLRKLYMTGNRLGTFGVKALTEAIIEDEIRRGEDETTFEGVPAEDDANVVSIDEDNPANDGDASSVMTMMMNDMVTTTTTKSLNHNDTMHKLSSSNSFSSLGLQEIFLGGTGMGSGGCQAVARLLEKTSCLRVLSLPNCSMGDEEIGWLACSIKANRDKLPIESIQLSFNNMTHKGLESLMNALWGSSTLKELRLDNNEIGDRGAHQVAAILPYVKTLEVLDVGFNSIKTPGLNTLMKAVAETNHLQSLSVSGNALDVTAAKAVAYALAYNYSLVSLFLVHCSIGHEGQRHISAGVVSNSRTCLQKLTGFEIGPVIVTLGFPAAIEHWTNEQVLNFVQLMWEKSKAEVEQSEEERELDPLSFLADAPNGGMNPASSSSSRPSGRGPPVPNRPLEATIVMEVAKKTYESLVANGVDVFTRRRGQYNEPSFGSPLAGDAIMVESPLGSLSSRPVLMDDSSSETGENGGRQHFQGTTQARSFVAEPESSISNVQKEMADPARKKRIVEWLCSNIRHLNELSQLPFSSAELWRLHQHYFTPVVNESGGEVASSSDPSRDLVMSSVPEVCNGTPVTPSTQSSSDHRSVPFSEPVLPSPNTTSLPMLKRKVSYRSLGDAVLSPHGRFRPQMDTQDCNHLRKDTSVARMIEAGHTGHSLPPKTKRARRNRTRISFVPRIKAKLDSYLDVCHEKALVTMRQLYFVEQALLGGSVNPLVEQSTSPQTHLSGVLASEAEMIIVDMI